VCIGECAGCVGEVLPIEDDGSAERQIQSVFDFLDEPDDLSRGLEYWGANPRHSVTEQDDDDEHKMTADSSDDDVIIIIIIIIITTKVTEETRETTCSFQRLSMTLQRANTH